VNPEVLCDLLDRHSGLAVARDADYVVTELARVGLGHDDILSGPPSRASHLRCHLSVQQTPLLAARMASSFYAAAAMVVSIAGDLAL
jgi:hypothetical protein